MLSLLQEARAGVRDKESERDKLELIPDPTQKPGEVCTSSLFLYIAEYGASAKEL